MLKNKWHSVCACPIEALLSMKKYYLRTPKMPCSIFSLRQILLRFSPIVGVSFLELSFKSLKPTAKAVIMFRKLEPEPLKSMPAF